MNLNETESLSFNLEFIELANWHRKIEDEANHKQPFGGHGGDEPEYRND